MVSFKEFMDNVEERLEKLSEEQLRELIRHRAEEVQPKERFEFLLKLVPPEHTAVNIDEEELFAELAAFEKRVEEGEYCNGWGWDDELCDERDWGDESWAVEAAGFLLEARSLLQEGESNLAERVYREIFELVALGEEPGHLPGDPDITNMLEDLDEHAALFLRSVYLNTPLPKRAETLYLELKNIYRHLEPDLTLRDIAESLAEPLPEPEYEQFLDDWVEFLKQCPQKEGELLREAVFLKGGVPAIAEFARMYPREYPKAYLDWLLKLEAQKTKLAVAREGLERIPRRFYR